MSIINITPVQTGLVGVLPSLAYINTDDTIAEVVTTGYLNKEVANGVQFNLPCIAAVSTKATPTSRPQVGWYQVSHIGANWSLVVGSNEAIVLPSAQILVGNASNVAAPVVMSGDITISNAGVTAIGNAKVLLAMLGAGIAPAGVVKFMGQSTTVGGSATEAFTVIGAAAATDRAFVQVVNNGTNNVSVLEAVVTANTLTITFSGNPGNDCVFNYQLIRAAS